MPFFAYATAAVGAVLGGSDLRSDEQVSDRARDEYFGRGAERGYPSRDVDGESRDVVANDLHLPRVQTGLSSTPRQRIPSERTTAMGVLSLMGR